MATPALADDSCKQPANAPARLICEELAENSLCRGLMTDDPTRDQHCEARNALEKRLAAMGYCFIGPNEVESKWRKCP